MKVKRGDLIAIEWGPEGHQRATGVAVTKCADAPGEWFLISQKDQRNYSGPVVENHTTVEQDPFDWTKQP